MYKLKKRIKFSFVELFFAAAFFLSAIFLVFIGFQFGIRGVRTLGSVKVSDEIAQLTPIILGLGIILFAVAIAIVLRNRKERQSLYFTVDKNKVEAVIKKQDYYFDLYTAKHLHLLRPISAVEYGYRDTMGFLTDFGWFVLPPLLVGEKPIEDIFGEILEIYTKHKVGLSDTLLKNGQCIEFPMLAKHNSANTLSLTSQNKFDACIYFDGFKSKQPINLNIPTAEVILIKEKSISYGGKEIEFSDIKEVMLAKYKNSILKQSEIRDWQKGELLSLLGENGDGEFIMEIPLPSVLDSDVLKALLLNRLSHTEIIIN